MCLPPGGTGTRRCAHATAQSICVHIRLIHTCCDGRGGYVVCVCSVLCHLSATDGVQQPHGPSALTHSRARGTTIARGTTRTHAHTHVHVNTTGRANARRWSQMPRMHVRVQLVCCTYNTYTHRDIGCDSARARQSTKTRSMGGRDSHTPHSRGACLPHPAMLPPCSLHPGGRPTCHLPRPPTFISTATLSTATATHSTVTATAASTTTQCTRALTHPPTHSTVTDLARLRGWSTWHLRRSAM